MSFMSEYNKKENKKIVVCKKVGIMVVAIVIAMIGAYTYNKLLLDTVVVTTNSISQAIVPQPLSLDEQAEKVFSTMTDEQKVGQLLMIGMAGTEVDETTLQMIQTYHIGGVTLFDRNMDNPRQVANLTNDLQKAALQDNAQLPLFIAVDQEGGQVLRMPGKVSPIPSQGVIASSNEPQNANLWAKRTGLELKAMGFNVNFAPAVDVGGTLGRTYGQDATVVTTFATEAMKGYQQAGILCTLKHFPGIGRSKVDLHFDVDRVTSTKETLENEDLQPFQRLIQEHDNQSFFIMVSHLKYPAYDLEYPASVSPIIISQVLRQQLGFQGLIVTDDMEMGALTKLYSFQDMGYLAVKAGADLLLVCHTTEHQIAVYDGILTALQQGRLERKVFDQAVRRVIKEKLAKLTYTKVDPEAALGIVGK